jgi:hypothetical protein
VIRFIAAVLLGLACLPGCTDTPPQRPSGSGVKVNAPGVDVDVGNTQPNTLPSGGVKVKTPRVDVEVGK